jgi:hypothetical protein
MKQLMISGSTALLALFFLGCSSAQIPDRPGAVAGTKVDPGKAYELAIGSYSDGDAEYNGFYNNFQYKATILNSAIRSELINKQSEYYQWEHQKSLSENEKYEKEMAVETDIFLSFYTPDRRNDNLSDPKSIWRIFLDVGGQRYEAKVKKVRSLVAEIQALYPYHTRWNSPYLLSFPVATAAIENQPTTLTITGPLGVKTVHFPAKSP